SGVAPVSSADTLLRRRRLTATGGRLSSCAKPMSSDEALVTITAVMIGPVLWSIWLVRMSRVQPLHHGRQAAATIGIALLASSALILFVLDTMAADDVVDAPVYQFMYLVIGLTWLRALETTFPYFGVSPRDDVFASGHRAAAPAGAGACIAISLC